MENKKTKKSFSVVWMIILGFCALILLCSAPTIYGLTKSKYIDHDDPHYATVTDVSPVKITTTGGDADVDGDDEDGADNANYPANVSSTDTPTIKRVYVNLKYRGHVYQRVRVLTGYAATSIPDVDEENYEQYGDDYEIQPCWHFLNYQQEKHLKHHTYAILLNKSLPSANQQLKQKKIALVYRR